MFFFCVYSRIPHSMQSSCILRFLWTVTGSQTWYVFDLASFKESISGILKHVPLLGFVRCFSHDETGIIGFWGEQHRRKLGFSFHPTWGTYIYIWLLDRVRQGCPWQNYSFPYFPYNAWLFLPTFRSVLFGRKSPTAYTWVRGYTAFLKVPRLLNRLFGILHDVPIHLFFSIMYVYQTE